jgi:hypothetical protein
MFRDQLFKCGISVLATFGERAGAKTAPFPRRRIIREGGLIISTAPTDAGKIYLARDFACQAPHPALMKITEAALRRLPVKSLQRGKR